MTVRRLTRRAAIAAVAALALARALASVAAQPAERIAIAVIPIEVGAEAYYASDLGYFKHAGIDATVTPLQNGPAIVAAVVSGTVDIGYSSALTVIVAHDKGLPLTILFGTDVPGAEPTNGILTVVASAPIHEARDFAGKTIAVSSLNSTNFYAVKDWIDTHGGDSSAARYVEVPAPQMADILTAGRVDAASMDAANLNSRPDLRVIAPTYPSVAAHFIGGCYFATTAWVEQHPDLARRFVASMHQAALFANAHHDAAAKLYAHHSRFPLADLLMAPRPTFSLAPIPALYQPLIDLAAKYGAIKASFPAQDVVAKIASPR